ncbi:MAG TPA: hypothetical protein VF902_00810 [Coriobacteriia bacterium]
MQFSVVCSVDGPVDVSVSDIASIVVRGEDIVDVVFECPRCGGDIRVTAQVPHMLMASLDEVIVVDESTGERRLRVTAVLEGDDRPVAGGSALPEAADPAEQERIARYCEYFRRQLESIGTVEAMLEEIDAR